MCIPPIDEEAAMHFALLKSYAEQLSLPQLSMGMSGDFEEAIALGRRVAKSWCALKKYPYKGGFSHCLVRDPNQKG